MTETIVRGRKGAVGVGEPKSDAGRRTLPIPAGLAGMLTDHMAAAGLTVLDHEALLFTSPGGGPLRYTNWLRRSWYPATIAAGLGRLVEDEASGRVTTSAWGSTICAVRPPRVWWQPGWT